MAAWALGELDDASAIEALSAAVQNDRSSDVKETAAWALGQIRPDHAPGGLVQALSSTDRDVRLSAAWALGQIRDSSAAPTLEKSLQSESDPSVRRAVFRALLMRGDRSESALTTALKSSDSEIREMATMALAGRGHRPWPWPWPRPRPFP
jgi:HEAT repeat protein